MVIADSGPIQKSLGIRPPLHPALHPTAQKTRGGDPAISNRTTSSSLLPASAHAVPG
jgi:hypothetical protein